MRWSPCLCLLALSGLAQSAGIKPRDYKNFDYYSIHIEDDTSPETLARALGLKYEEQIGSLNGHHYFSIPRATKHHTDEVLQSIRARRRKRDPSLGPLGSVKWYQKQKLKPRLEKRGAIVPLDVDDQPALRAAPVIPKPANVDQATAAIAQRQKVAKELSIHDPIFSDQWHLFNSVELGHDLNVTGLWLAGITGKNTTVVVVDDGLDMYSDDLKDNYFAEGSYDFNDHTDEPRPRLSDDHHGTRCAGEIAAVRNDACGVGVAYDAKVAGLRILSKSISDEDEAVAINYEMQRNQIYSCSWGPPDNGKAMDAPSTLIKAAILNGIQNGRGGNGSVFVFAAGNGAAKEDNCNFDGYTNSIYSITVGAIDRKGLHPYYSELCSAQLVVTYSSGSGDAIHTTDVGTNNCYTNHGGTSAAAPLGAGIMALVLQVRPELSWRDLQYLCVQTAIPVNEHEEWQTTSIGKKYSHAYGYGKLDAWALVEAAKTFSPVKRQAWYKAPWQHVKHAIPEGNQGLSSSFEVTADALASANLERVEHVQVTMNIEHTRRGDLSVDLISPAGLTSHLSTTRRYDEHHSGYVDWTFMSVVHWGEPGVGNWTVVVRDTDVNDHHGEFTDWRLTLWGECIDPAKAVLAPMPTDHDDDDHDVMSAIVGTTTVASLSSTALPDHPTDHPNRPVNQKPSLTASTDLPSATQSSTPAADTTPTATAGFLLPSLFPTFGVSPRTQIWIYGAIGTILVFCVGLGVYCCILRRRRARTTRADYEFEMLDDQDRDAGQPLSGGGRVKRRAGELYDAFAGESDEEMFSDGDAEGYRDEEEIARSARTGSGTDSASGDGDHLAEK